MPKVTWRCRKLDGRALTLQPVFLPLPVLSRGSFLLLWMVVGGAGGTITAARNGLC